MENNNNSLNSEVNKTTKILLTEQNLQEFTKRFNKILFNEFVNSLKRTNIRQRTLHIKLAEKGICTLYYLYFISKSAVFNVYKLRAANPTLKYSWEIEDNILNYTPLIFSKYAYLNSSRVIFVNKQYTDKQYILLDDYRFNMYHLAKEYKSIYDIIKVIKERFTQYSEEHIKSHVFNFFLELEQADMTLFLKCIN
jgi:L-rhamnose mutarotase